MSDFTDLGMKKDQNLRTQKSGLQSRHLVPALGLGLILTLSACSGLNPLEGFSTVRTQGYEISDSALQQIRPGQSADLVTTVLGSPASKSTFGAESAFYYVETKVEKTTIGFNSVRERTVLAVYFDENDRVKDTAIYGLEDGRIFDIQSRRTPSFGEDRTFIESIIQSF